MDYRAKYYISLAALILSCGWVLAAVNLILSVGFSGQAAEKAPLLIAILVLGFIAVGISWPTWTYYRARKDGSQKSQIEIEAYAKLGQQNLNEQEEAIQNKDK